MENVAKTIWIDLDNSPHVPLFVPIIRHYRAGGVNVIVTARDHSQTLELLKLHGLDGTYSVIGRHHGAGKLSKIVGSLARARQLATFIGNGPKIAVAVSHGSRSMVLAARWLGIPVVTMYDYEFTETRIFNRFSTRVLVPDRIPDGLLDEIGLSVSKRVKYSGIKEELYTRFFEPQIDFRRAFLDRHGFGAKADSVLAVIRPPATTANYHAVKGEDLLRELLTYLAKADDVFSVIVPRTPEQAAEIAQLIAELRLPEGRFLILSEAVDGLQLAFAADLLISGGGTMNREAALLGVPVYSIFAGKLGALDAQMESEGVITFIRESSDLPKIKLEWRQASDRANTLTDRVESFVIGQINTFLGTDTAS